MTTIYKGDIGTLLIVDCGVDISSATVKEIKFNLPDGTLVERTATLSGTNYLNYNLVSGDTAIAGLMRGQAYVEMPSGKWSGETFEFDIMDYYF